jgi:methyltransferase
VIAGLSLLIFLPMLIEARRAATNERAQRSRGGIQPLGDVAVYRWMQLAYPGAFIAMLVEGTLRGGPTRPWLLAGLTCYGVSKAVKWWAILTLGQFWTFRVVVIPGASLVTRGPYRFLRHPNYVAVIGELISGALMTGAAVSGSLAVVLFGMLISRRISVEDEALASSARHPPCSL